MSLDWVNAKWSAPSCVRAFTTARNGGASLGNYRALNLSYDVGDDPSFVDQNREYLTSYIGRRVPFLKAEHDNNVIDVDKDFPDNLYADGAVIRQPFHAMGILTADCLPVFFSNKEGTVAAIAHAGWRGLYRGILENTVKNTREHPSNLVAFIGPSISPYGYLVGADVYYAFKNRNIELVKYFSKSTNPNVPDKAHCDLKGIAVHILKGMGIREVNVHESDTYRDRESFFSYRRDFSTGRMASVILLLPKELKKVNATKIERDVFGELKVIKEVDIPLDFV